MKTSDQEQRIKQAIQELHDKGSGDFQSLLREVGQRKIELNLPQMVAARSPAKTLMLEWGRGTGKTTMYGYRWSQILTEMPRSTGLLIGPTYQAILTRIVPSSGAGTGDVWHLSGSALFHRPAATPFLAQQLGKCLPAASQIR